MQPDVSVPLDWMLNAERCLSIGRSAIGACLILQVPFYGLSAMKL
jgi:hypothetical protein